GKALGASWNRVANGRESSLACVREIIQAAQKASQGFFVETLAGGFFGLFEIASVVEQDDFAAEFSFPTPAKLLHPFIERRDIHVPGRIVLVKKRRGYDPGAQRTFRALRPGHRRVM